MFWMVSAIPIFWHTPSVKFSQSDILTSVRAHKMTRNARWQSRRSRYKAAAHVPNFDILAPAPELSLVEAINIPFRNMTTQLYRERQLWSGSENVKIGDVSGSFVAGTSASYPGVPRHISFFILTYFSLHKLMQMYRMFDFGMHQVTLRALPI